MLNAKRTSAIEILEGRLAGFAGGARQPMFLDGREVGAFYDGDTARYCCIAPILPDDISLSRTAQAESVFDTMVRALKEYDMEFTDTVRTWFYLDGLLDWYADFNDVRTLFFEKHAVFESVVPASTAIGAANPAGAALAAGLLAVKPINGSVSVREVDSPLQGSAMDYRSSFSRAVAVATPRGQTLYISGTASIDKDGLTLHVSNPRLQIQKTMEVVSAILTSCSMSWGDAARGVVYYPDAAYHDLFLEYCGKEGIPDFPLSTLEADICRKELLFEIELDARTVTG